MGLKELEADLGGVSRLEADLANEGTIRKPTVFENARLAGSGALEKIGVPAHGARNISEFVIPANAKDAAIAGGLALMNPAGRLSSYALAEASPIVRAVVSRLARYAAPALGGAIGGAAQGENPLWGAARGGAAGVLGDVAPVAVKAIGRAIGSGAV